MARQRDQMQRGAAIRQKAFQDTHSTGGRRQLPAGGLARAPLTGAQNVTGAGTAAGRYSARGMLTAELLAGAGIVAIRAVADYEPQADGTLKGKIGHPSGQYGPLPILAGLIGTFFLLSFLAARGGTRAKVAVIGGGLIVLVLGMKSVDEMTKVSQTFGSFGKGKVPAGDWQTSGSQSGTPVQGTTSGSSGPGSGSSKSSSSSESDLSKAGHWVEDFFDGIWHRVWTERKPLGG